MSSIILIHPPGPDRDALASFLRSEVDELLAVSAGDGLRDELTHAGGFTEPLVFILHEESAAGLGSAGFLRDHPIFILGRQRSVEFPELRQRFDIPYFPADILDALRPSLTPRGGPRRASAGPPHGTLVPDASTGDLLRSLAHGLKNPLAGADGWLQLLAQGHGPEDPAARPLKQVRNELQRLATMLHAMALLGTQPVANAACADLAALLAARRREADAEAFPIEWHIDGSKLMVCADAAVLDTALKLIFSSFCDERTRVRELTLTAQHTAHGVVLVLQEESDLLKPLAQRAQSLAALLRDVRPPRALAWALLVKTAEDCGGAVAVTHHDGHTTLQLTLRNAQTAVEATE